MKKLLAFLVMIVVAMSTPKQCFASDSCKKNIKEFLYILENKPTLASCEKLVMGESELILEYIICEERGWVPRGSKKIYPRCVEFTNKRAKHDENPCLYLMWLRSKIPTSPATFKVLSSEYIKENMTRHVTVLLDSVSVEFVIPDYGAYGDIDIRSINGEDVFDILERDVREGFSPSIYLEEASRAQARPGP